MRPTEQVMLAVSGPTPTPSRAGNATRVPPPATALMAPATTPAPVTRAAWAGVTRTNLGERRVRPLPARLRRCRIGPGELGQRRDPRVALVGPVVLRLRHVDAGGRLHGPQDHGQDDGDE